MDIERRPFAGDRGLAHSLCARAADRLDLAQAEELRPDHGIMIPLMFIDPKGTMPVVPILVNANMDPAPSPARCALLGELIDEWIAHDVPADKRAFVLATGDLSHWINIERDGTVNAAFDEQGIPKHGTGRPAPAVALEPEERR